MVEIMSTFIKRSRIAVSTGLIALLVASTAGIATVMQPQDVSAASCDKVNIAYCGLTGGSLNGYISSFKHLYNSGNNNGHHDLRAVYRWAGATNASVAKMNTSNTKMGTLYRNGQIKVNGTVVGKNAWVSARFGGGKPGFKQILPGVWARKTTTSFAQASASVIVHFNSAGVMDFAVMTGCGNAVTATPVRPPRAQPMPVINCVNLTGNRVKGTLRKYTFTAKGSAKHTAITSYTFNFGDGKTRVVKTGKTKASVNHQFAKYNKKYTITVVVNGKHGSDKCKTTITTPKKPVKPEECKPGIPVGDERCEETPTPPTTPVTPTKPTPPTEAEALPNTGMSAGAIVSLFGAVVAAAGFAHRYYMSRKLGF